MDDAHDYDAIWRGSGAAIWRAVYAYAGGRRDVADDAVSEAFARMMARGAAVREPEPYLYRRVPGRERGTCATREGDGRRA